MKHKHIAVAILVASFVGCASVDVTKTGKGFYNQTNPNEVEILKTRPERSYVELGTVTATGFTPADTAKMHNAIRSKSAALGANAAILTEEGMIPDGWGGGTKWATGVAVRYK
jgi:hypothetical protein